MKKLVLLLPLIIFLLSCDDTTNKVVEDKNITETEEDTIPTLIGNFVFAENSAILRGEDFIYEVKIDSLSRSLAQEIEPFKNEDFDMVPVKVKGKIKQSPRQKGIKENLEIREIIAVLADSTKNKSNE